MLRAHDSCYPKSLIRLSPALFPTPSPTYIFKLNDLNFYCEYIIFCLLMSRSFETSFFDVCSVREAWVEKAPPQFLLLHIASYSYFYLLCYLNFILFIILLKESLVSPVFKVRELFGIISIGRRFKT